MLPIHQKLIVAIKGARVPDQGMVKIEFDELVFYKESPIYRMHFTGLRNIDPSHIIKFRNSNCIMCTTSNCDFPKMKLLDKYIRY